MTGVATVVAPAGVVQEREPGRDRGIDPEFTREEPAVAADPAPMRQAVDTVEREAEVRAHQGEGPVDDPAATRRLRLAVAHARTSAAGTRSSCEARAARGQKNQLRVHK